MRPKIDFLTIAVSDLERSVAFYKDGLGLPTCGIQDEPWGYSESFADPDGHPWEISLMPHYPESKAKA